MFATGIPPHVEVFRAIAASEGRQKAHVERVLDERGVNAGTVTDGRLSSVVAASESRTNEKLDEIKSLLVQQSGNPITGGGGGDGDGAKLFPWKDGKLGHRRKQGWHVQINNMHANLIICTNNTFDRARCWNVISKFTVL